MPKSITCFALTVVFWRAPLRADDLDKNFASPPDSAKPRTWWHWISGNISKDGITKDLEAMKRVGVGGAQCFTVDQDPDPKTKGHVLYMSPEWQQLTQHAISECHRLGLELSITACEGWSESGGNWITPEQSMQKVVWSAKHVSGPMKYATTLRQPRKRSRAITATSRSSPIRHWPPTGFPRPIRRRRRLPPPSASTGRP